MMKAINIVWDTDGENIVLPTEIEIPEDIVNAEYEDEISDYITDQTGFCHYVFDLVD